MNRFLLLPLLTAVLGGALAWGDETNAPSAAEQGRRFRRDRELIRMLVDSSLRLAAEDDPLKRADHCNGVADRLAVEIRYAFNAREGARALELGQHLHAMLERGVAVNLFTATRDIPGGSAREPELAGFSKRVILVTDPLEEHLLRIADPDLREDAKRTLKEVVEGRAEVEKVLRSRRQPPVKGGAGKPDAPVPPANGLKSKR